MVLQYYTRIATNSFRRCFIYMDMYDREFHGPSRLYWYYNTVQGLPRTRSAGALYIWTCMTENFMVLQDYTGSTILYKDCHELVPQVLYIYGHV